MERKVISRHEASWGEWTIGLVKSNAGLQVRLGVQVAELAIARKGCKTIWFRVARMRVHGREQDFMYGLYNIGGMTSYNIIKRNDFHGRIPAYLPWNLSRAVRWAFSRARFPVFLCSHARPHRSLCFPVFPCHRRRASTAHTRFFFAFQPPFRREVNIAHVAYVFPVCGCNVIFAVKRVMPLLSFALPLLSRTIDHKSKPCSLHVTESTRQAQSTAV